MERITPIVKLKTLVLKLRLCDYSDPYILLSGSVTITGAGADDAVRRVGKRNCAPFIDRISEINNTQIDNTKYIDFAMPIYN